MSTRIESISSNIAMTWGMISSAGTGIGNWMKTGRKAVEIGTKNSRFEG